MLARYKSVFDMIDEDRSGSISVDELRSEPLLMDIAGEIELSWDGIVAYYVGIFSVALMQRPP